jgi:hypothetical protein
VEKREPSLFGRRLKQLIDERAKAMGGPDFFNESRLAKLLKVPQQRINDLIRGRVAEPRGSFGQDVAKQFGVNPAWLYREDAPRDPVHITTAQSLSAATLGITTMDPKRLALTLNSFLKNINNEPPRAITEFEAMMLLTLLRTMVEMDRSSASG